ncbi:MAG: hypothetical protein U1F04_00235 [Burkholderiaceae bacterium]
MLPISAHNARQRAVADRVAHSVTPVTLRSDPTFGGIATPSRSTPAALHVQIEPLHERVPLSRVEPGEAETNPHPRHSRQADHPGLANGPTQRQRAIGDAHIRSVAAHRPNVCANSLRQPAKPFGFGASHFSVELFRIRRLHGSTLSRDVTTC